MFTPFPAIFWENLCLAGPRPPLLPPTGAGLRPLARGQGNQWASECCFLWGNGTALLLGGVNTQTHKPTPPNHLSSAGTKENSGNEKSGVKKSWIQKMRGKERAFSRPPVTHRLSLRLFLRWGLDWPRCGEDTSFFRSLVGEGGPVPLPILGGKKQTLVPGLPQSLACSVGATCPKAALGGPRKLKPPLCPASRSAQTCSGH